MLMSYYLYNFLKLYVSQIKETVAILTVNIHSKGLFLLNLLLTGLVQDPP